MKNKQYVAMFLVTAFFLFASGAVLAAATAGENFVWLATAQDSGEAGGILLGMDPEGTPDPPEPDTIEFANDGGLVNFAGGSGSIHAGDTLDILASRIFVIEREGEGENDDMENVVAVSGYGIAGLQVGADLEHSLLKWSSLTVGSHGTPSNGIAASDFDCGENVVATEVALATNDGNAAIGYGVLAAEGENGKIEINSGLVVHGDLDNEIDPPGTIEVRNLSAGIKITTGGSILITLGEAE